MWAALRPGQRREESHHDGQQVPCGQSPAGATPSKRDVLHFVASVSSSSDSVHRPAGSFSSGACGREGGRGWACPCPNETLQRGREAAGELKPAGYSGKETDTWTTWVRENAGNDCKGIECGKRRTTTAEIVYGGAHGSIYSVIRGGSEARPHPLHGRGGRGDARRGRLLLRVLRLRLCAQWSPWAETHLVEKRNRFTERARLVQKSWRRKRGIN